VRVKQFIMIDGGIASVFSSLYLLSVELQQCLVVYIDCRWNYGTDQ
jgi:hypothetical protein